MQDLTFSAHEGTASCYQSPNIAGKTTTTRMIAGLERPTSDKVSVNGHQHRASKAPLIELGFSVETISNQTERSARGYLLAWVRASGIGRPRLNDVIADAVGPTKPSASFARSNTPFVVPGHPLPQPRRRDQIARARAASARGNDAGQPEDSSCRPGRHGWGATRTGGVRPR